MTTRSIARCAILLAVSRLPSLHRQKSVTALLSEPRRPTSPALMLAVPPGSRAIRGGVTKGFDSKSAPRMAATVPSPPLIASTRTLRSASSCSTGPISAVQCVIRWWMLGCRSIRERMPSNWSRLWPLLGLLIRPIGPAIGLTIGIPS